MVQFPSGYQVEPLQKKHPRKAFQSGEPRVDEWLRSQALQQQEKRLSTTKVLLSASGGIAGYYTLASGQVDFSDLPEEFVKKLPRRQLPVAVMAWFGIANTEQGQGLGDRLIAQALNDCYAASATFPFIAVVLDCLTEQAKAFYRRWDFGEVPENPNRLYLPFVVLERLARGS